MSEYVSTPSWSLKKSAELGGRAMLAWLDPQDNYMPISGYEPVISLRFAAGGQYGKMTKEELDESENAASGLSLYMEPLTSTDDPYLYMRW